MKNVLVINAGSSSLKYQLIDMETENVLAKGLCERIGIDGRLNHTPAGKDKIVKDAEMKDHADALKYVIDALTDAETGVIKDMGEIAAVGHRVVHGGEYISKSVVINDEIKDIIKKCNDLAPLHNPANLIGIEACEKMMPGVAQVGVFDTAFHQTMPEYAYMYGIPYEYYDKYKIRKYGFHGTSHKFVSKRAAEMLNKPIEELKIITLHLGNGSSITAVKNGKSIDTTMGFTPLAGVIMGTRCGLIDPAIVPYIMKKENLTPDEIDNVMNKKSGVLGISGVSSDFRDIESEASKGNKKAQLALDMFNYSVKVCVGMYATIMGGVDAIVFTAGVGENNIALREQIINDNAFLGCKIDAEKNNIRGKEAIVSTEDSKVKVLVIPTNEELMIARDTLELINK